MDSRQRTPRLERDSTPGSLGVSTLAAFNATDIRQIRVTSGTLVRTAG